MGERLEQMGKFEPDPAKWSAGTQGKRVWFEWQHVTCLDGRPPHVEIKANQESLDIENLRLFSGLNTSTKAKCIVRTE